MTVLDDVVPGGGSPPGLQAATFWLCPLVGKEVLTCLSLLIRMLIPSQGPHPHDLLKAQSPPKAPLPVPSQQGLELR